MMWTDEQVRRATREPAPDHAEGGFSLLAGFAVLGLIFMLAVLVPDDQSDVLRHRCDLHGGIFRSAVDGARIISVTCRDGEEFSR